MMSLIIGGAGSGKSAFAEQLCCSLGGKRLYLATMKASDPESMARVSRHHRMREGKNFQTLELPSIRSFSRIPQNQNILLEDLSNLLANELYSPDGHRCEDVLQAVRSLRETSSHLTIVTNEVFSGGSAYEGETLRFLSDLAWINRKLASEADMVAEIVSGLPNVLKGERSWQCLRRLR